MQTHIPCDTYEHCRQICLTAGGELATFAKDVLAGDTFYRAGFLFACQGLLDTTAMMAKGKSFCDDPDVYLIELDLHDILLEHIAGIAGIVIAFSEVLKFNELKLIGGRLLDAYRFLYNYRWVQL